MISLAQVVEDDFAASRGVFETILRGMKSDDARSFTHSDLEEYLLEKGPELMRQLIQDYLERRAREEPRLDVVQDADGVERGSVENGHQRGLTTVFGDVAVTRKAYRQRGHANLHPADGDLNLPPERYSHTLRRAAAIEASRGSYDEAVEAIERQTRQRLGKRQVEELAIRSAVDFESFYRASTREPCGIKDTLVLSCDGKGIVMRPEGLREATRRESGRSQQKLATRLSKGEKGNRKRIAEVGSVYDCPPVPRQAEDILRASGDQEGKPAPQAKAKWVTASVVDDAAEVVARVFDEAERRDPEHRRTWIALVDGNNHQIERIQGEARKRGVQVAIVVDFVHVIEYVWKAAWSFFDEGDPEVEAWVRSRLLAILKGGAGRVAAGIRASATRRGLPAFRREGADKCAGYLANKSRFLDYPRALWEGWPIATGVIEGACRHLVKDRMDLTGARWGLQGAEAILKLRALRTNGDFEAYWQFHLRQEKRRNHQSRYLGYSIPGEPNVT